MVAIQRSKKPWTSSGPKRSQIPCSASGWSQAANPVVQGPEPETDLGCLALGPLMAVDPHLGRIGEVGADLDEAGAEVGIDDVEVVDAHPALLLEERKAAAPGVPAAEDPLELLGGDDGHHAVAAVALGGLQIGAHVVDLAVVEAGAIRRLQPQHQNGPVLGHAPHVSSEPVADLLEQRRGGQHVAQMVVEEPSHLAGHLQLGHVGV